MITVDHLTFDYPGVRALDDVSFHLASGSITALVGPNGAGKTTLLRCLAGLEQPLAGTIVVDGVDVLADPRACRRQLGYLSDVFGVYDELTVRRCLLHAAAVHGLSGSAEVEAAQRAATRLDIADRLDQQAGALSRGLRQRLAIAQAIVHAPKIVLLDEPASGLDPEARHALAALFLRLRGEGMTLLVSSHILAELEEYSTEMLVLREGRIVAHTPIGQARTTATEVGCMVAFSRPVDELARQLAGIEGLSGVKVEGLQARVVCSGDAEAQHRLLRAMLDRGLPVCGFTTERRTMQEAYLTTVAEPKKEVAP